MPFLSVIIPVYNVEPYLRQCVDSVLNQNLEDYELILVDDGSPDSCPQICDQYALENLNVRVIHKENGGLSSARNAGLHIAQGDYIAFMDSDDWWNPKVSVNRMLGVVRDNQDADVFLFSGLDYVEGVGYYERADSVQNLGGNRYNAIKYYKVMLSSGNLQVHAATKILKTKFLRENKLGFKNGLKGEDNEWMIRLLRFNPSIMILPDQLYIYRTGRPDSITATIKSSNVSDLLQIVESSIEYYKITDANSTLMEFELCFCAYLWFCALGLSGSLNSEENEDLTKLFVKTSLVCTYSNSRKTVIAYILYRTIGLNKTRFVLHTYIRIKRLLSLNKKKAKSI